MREADLEEKLGEFPMFCPECKHFVEAHLMWAHQVGRSEDEFDPTQCRQTNECECDWLIKLEVS